MWIYLIIVGIFITIMLFEFRVRRPDRIVVYESKGKVQQRMARFYPRHFSLAIQATVLSLFPEIEAESSGKLNLRVKLAVTVAPSKNHLSDLIRVAGWVDKAETELLKNNPELILLTPQAARLAEASQSLRNARTVVSLSPNDLTEGSAIAGLLQALIQKLGQGDTKKKSGSERKN